VRGERGLWSKVVCQAMTRSRKVLDGMVSCSGAIEDNDAVAIR
jgi:hypothetical protein